MPVGILHSQADSENLVQRTYLLDTSAFRALPAARLAVVSQSMRLLVSPFCFWELLTHLEDEGQFGRVKGNLMKFQHVSVLDDPWASVEHDVVRLRDGVHDRLNDCELIYAMLAALRDSGSVSDFYGKQICDSRNQIRKIAGCVSRVGNVLRAEEQRFQEYMTKIMTVVRDGCVSLETPADRHRGTLDVLEAWRIQLGGRIDESEAVRERLARRTYVYSSYVLHMAVDYVQRAVTKVDLNDFEDAKFCQHLALDAEMTAITADAALQQCVRNTLAVLNALPDASWHTKLQVSSDVEFAVAS